MFVWLLDSADFYLTLLVIFHQRAAAFFMDFFLAIVLLEYNKNLAFWYSLLLAGLFCHSLLEYSNVGHGKKQWKAHGENSTCYFCRGFISPLRDLNLSHLLCLCALSTSIIPGGIWKFYFWNCSLFAHYWQTSFTRVREGLGSAGYP